MRARRFHVRPWRLDPRVIDVALVIALAGSCLAQLPSLTPGPGRTPAAVGLALLQTLPLVWRKRAPLVVWAVVLTAAAVWFTLGWSDTAGTLGALPIAVANVALHGSRRAARGAAVVTAGAFLVSVGVAGKPLLSFAILTGAVTFAAAWLLGDNLRRRRVHTAMLEERALDLERARDEHARRLVLEERARIARELHDIVAHHVSMIVVQAETGPYLVDASPDTTASAFASIGATARQALVEMRWLLGVLREDAHGPASRRPQPGVADIPDLVDEVRRAGYPVDLDVRGHPSPLPASVDLSAYRIVQEALTNIRKHAGPASADVVVDYRGDVLHLSIVDDGRGSTVPGVDREGHGLVGVRERVAMLGGRIETGRTSTGGFALSASLPLGSSPL